MDAYGLSDDELFSSCLLNFTWENSFEQVRASHLGIPPLVFPAILFISLLSHSVCELYSDFQRSCVGS